MTYRVLPPGVSEAQFALALADFAKAVGPDAVFTDDERMLPYRKILIPVEEDRFAPSGVVMARTVEEVQAVLAVCNRYKVPVWPISTGRNFGYGSANPATRGCMILDLKRMNRIIEVDPVLCTALVEPGVTYQQLQDYLKERNIPLWLDFPGPGPLVGPVGNTLERGGGNTPYGDHFANACGMEVVLADGKVLKTGMGSIPNSTSWQVFRYGYGPYLDGMFTQSNFGVVTKMGLWLMPAPAGHETFMVQYANAEDLAAAVDTVRPLRLQGLIPNVGVMGNANIVLTSFKRKADLYTGEGAVPDDILLAAAKTAGLGAWNVLFSLYGTEAQMAPNREIVTAAFEASGGKVIRGISDPAQVNQLSLASFSLLNWVGGGGLSWFAPVSPARGADALKQQTLAKTILRDHGFDYLAAPTLNGRDLHHLVAMVFDHAQPAEVARAADCFRALVTRFGAEGYGLYRVGIDFMDELADIYGATNREVNRAIKRALDPNGVIAPGKSGIRI